MKSNNNEYFVKQPIRMGFLVCLLYFASCSSYLEKKDITNPVSANFIHFASDTDSMSIKAISIFDTNKKLYSGYEHMDIAIDYEIQLHNISSDKMTYQAHDSLGYSRFYAIYRNDTVCWVVALKSEQLQILPCETLDITLSNIGFMGAAIFSWESIFPTEYDYTKDVIDILPQIKIYYDNTQILPSRDIKITISNNKDGWLLYQIHRLLGDPYWDERN